MPASFLLGGPNGGRTEFHIFKIEASTKIGDHFLGDDIPKVLGVSEEPLSFLSRK